MHEASIAQGILDAVLASLPNQQARVLSVHVVAGVLAGVEGESLELYWQELTRGTQAEAARIELRRQPARLVCQACSRESEYDGAGGLAIVCAACGGNNRLVGGSELYIESVEIDSDDE